MIQDLPSKSEGSKLQTNALFKQEYCNLPLFFLSLPWSNVWWVTWACSSSRAAFPHTQGPPIIILSIHLLPSHFFFKVRIHPMSGPLISPIHMIKYGYLTHFIPVKNSVRSYWVMATQKALSLPSGNEGECPHLFSGHQSSPTPGALMSFPPLYSLQLSSNLYTLWKLLGKLQSSRILFLFQSLFNSHFVSGEKRG